MLEEFLAARRVTAGVRAVACAVTCGVALGGAPLCGAPGAGAQTPAAPRFSLADALALAGARHPAIQVASGRRAAELAVARQDAALPNPVLEYRRENLGAPIAPDIFTTVTLPVDLLARRLALRGVAGDVAARTAADSAGIARAVAYDVTRAYWRAALARGLGEVAAAQCASVDSLAVIEERRAREGAIAEGNAMRVRLEADRTHLTAATAQAEAERARADLARALALPPNQIPWPTDSLTLTPPFMQSRVRVARFDGASAVDDTAGNALADAGPLDSAGVARLVAGALRTRPDVIAARARVAGAERRVAAERLGAIPGIGLLGGAKRTSGYGTGVVGVAVALPVFDRNANLRARAAGELTAAQAELRIAEAQATADVTAGARAYAVLAAERAPVALDARGRDVAAVARAAYREGAASLLEVLDAERARADVRAAALRWAAELRLARLELTRATTAGGPLGPDPGPNLGVGPTIPISR